MKRRLTPILIALLLISISGIPLWAQTKAGVKAAPGSNLTAAYNSYLNRLRNKVLNNWNVPDGKNHVVLEAIVAADGTLGEVVTRSTPNNAAAEQSASGAFSLAQPLEALPATSPPVKVILTFESTADPHGDSSSNLLSRLEPIKAAAGLPSNP